MSDHFITNITGVPTTGQYGPDGKPLNVNNDGGIEVTPQGAGNVPSVGTESREGIGNDKSITGNPYNQNASSTDSQSIGPSSPPDQTHYANAQSHSLYKQAQIGGDKDDWNLYKQDPVDVLSGDLSTYDGYWAITSSTKITEGQSTFNPTPLSPIQPPPVPFTYTLGGTTQTVARTSTTWVATQKTTGKRENKDSPCYSGTSDVPCEIATCADGTPLGKKMRLFQGEGCMGLNGYWMQLTNPMASPVAEQKGKVYKPPLPYGYDPTKCDQFTLDPRRRARIWGIPPGWSLKCWDEYKKETSNDPSVYVDAAVWAHRLTYVGEDLTKISDKKWCEYCDETNPQQSQFPYGRCYNVAGYRRTFIEGPSCRNPNIPEDEFDGRLYGCCCSFIPNDDDAPNYNCGKNAQSLFVLNEVAEFVILGGEDDPCDCRYRENNGAIFEDKWRRIRDGTTTTEGVFVSGCTEASAQAQATANSGNNVYIMTTGTGEAPYFSSGVCAWMYSFSGAERCSELDHLDGTLTHTSGYCPTGAEVQISDRYLFEDSDRFTSYTGCEGGVCTPCAIGDSLFEVGDYVNIAAYQLSGYEYNALTDGFMNGYVIDLTKEAVAGNTLGGPFFTGCDFPDNIGHCVWTFEETHGGPPQNPGLGKWTLTGSGDCCDCNAVKPTGGLQPDGTYVWNDTETQSFDCSTRLNGCNVLETSWRIESKQSGNWNSTPDSLDCTWGYRIQFTGCPPDAGQCSGTGFAPSSLYDYIPEHYFTTGTDCV